VGFKVIPRLLMSAARRKAEPVFVSMVDNNKATGRYTARDRLNKTPFPP
jgi:hypothetical protein